MDRLFAIIFQSFLLLVVSLKNQVSSDNTYLGSVTFSCSFTSNNATISYLNNVNHLFYEFTRHASQSSYYNTSVGDSPDKVYGYYMCRGDTTSRGCYSCILNAAHYALESSCVREEGLSYSEMCTFRYSNHSMYGLSEEGQFLVVSSNASAESLTQQQYNKTLTDTTEALIEKAASGCNATNDERCVPGYATKERNVTGDETIYSMAQCTPDIVGANCSKCLHYAYGQLQTYHGREAYTPNCRLKYDNTSFYDIPKAIPIIDESSRSPPNPLPSSDPLSSSLSSCVPPSPLHSWLFAFELVSCIYLLLL